VLVVVRLDRLAQSARDLLNVLDEIGKRGDGFRSLKDTWADTTTPHGKLMVTVLGGLAEFERTLIAARTGEGRKRAKERGLLFGRPHKMTPYQRQEALQRLAAWRLWRLKSAKGGACAKLSAKDLKRLQDLWARIIDPASASEETSPLRCTDHPTS
jgi:DNA invertase Pin-like site-specific DNA recombinase